MPKNYNLGYYIKEKHISKALELLEYQLEQTNPLYNITDFTIYKNLSEKLNPEKFHKDFIKRDSFYYFENKFHLIKYYGVQRAYKIREFHYFSRDLLVLYYALGFYFIELLEKHIANTNEIFSKKPLKVFYGGSINFEKPKNSKIYYYEDYKEFLSLKEQYTKPEEGKIKYAISLDIKSFFYSIDHKLLLDVLERKAYPTSKKALEYNEYTKESIEFFLKFLMSDSKGIPVSGQNIFSSFISSIYFSDFDEFVVDNYLNTNNFKYIRYVDDFYLIYTVDSTTLITEVRKQIYAIENQIADFLIDNLKLSVSTSKSDRFMINDDQSQLDFLKSTGFESPFEQEFDYEYFYEDTILSLEIKDKKAPEIFDECIKILSKIKNQTNELAQIDIDSKESSYLNFILIHKGCLAYSKSEEAKEKVRVSAIFNDFDNLDFILMKIKVILHLLTTDDIYRKTFFVSLITSIKNPENLTQKVSILDKFIHQIQFLLNEAKGETKVVLENEYLYYVEESILYLKEIINKNQNQYFSIFYKSLNKSYELNSFKFIYPIEFLYQESCLPLLQQIKQRNVNEKLGFYNVCFNHLLNEFQNFFEMIFFDGKEKDASVIKSKMTESGFKFNDIKFVAEFFDRRNQNSISHTNKFDIGFWGVGKKEYENYKSKIEKITLDIYTRFKT